MKLRNQSCSSSRSQVLSHHPQWLSGSSKVLKSLIEKVIPEQGCHQDFKLLGKYNQQARNQIAKNFFWFYFSSTLPLKVARGHICSSRGNPWSLQRSLENLKKKEKNVMEAGIHKMEKCSWMWGSGGEGGSCWKGHHLLYSEGPGGLAKGKIILKGFPR